MEKYTIYCTEEQTKKALKLGAPLLHIFESMTCMNIIIEENSHLSQYAVPTAEQMIGWLRREKGIFVSTETSEDWYYGTYHLQKDSGIWTCKEYVDGYFETPEKATLAAIDAALDFLIKNNK